MNLSPEERAAKVVADYFASDLDIINGAEGEKRTIEALIATAIRQACNEKLEEAADRYLNSVPPVGILDVLNSLKDTTP